MSNTMAQPNLASKWRVPVGDARTLAIFEPALQPDADTLFIFAHGAGGHRDDRGMLALSEQLRGRGLHVVRFNFLYREKGSGRPDPMPLLKQCIVEVAARARREIQSNRVII